MGNSQIMSMRLSDEVQELFKSSTQSSGLKQEEFLVKLLSTYAKHGEDQDTNITQEKAQVRAGLERIRVLVEAVIDRAGDQSKQAEETINIKQNEFSQRFNVLKEEVQKKNETIKTLTTENKRLSENEESREMLRQAFRENENSAKLEIESLQSKLNILKSVIDEKEQLKKELAECKDKIRDIELSHQKEINEILQSGKEELQAFILSYSESKGKD